jgi:hypothetical protein
MLGIFCRGLLYLGVIQEQGSQLADRAAKNAFVEKLKDVPVELLSHLPVVGEFVGPIKIFAEAVLALTRKEEALKKLQKQLGAYTEAEQFAHAYLSALAVWSSWADPLSDSMAGILSQWTKISERASEP